MNNVVLCHELSRQSLTKLLEVYGLVLCWVDENEPIPGSHFGEPEAGLILNQLYVRGDTPVHSLLHESCHFVCMDQIRRNRLHTDAGGDYDEENAVCYLSIVLAGYLDEYNSERMMRDMDEWGYTFRLGSARDWYDKDADDARDWLLSFDIIDQRSRPTGKVRTNP